MDTMDLDRRMVIIMESTRRRRFDRLSMEGRSPPMGGWRWRGISSITAPRKRISACAAADSGASRGVLRAASAPGAVDDLRAAPTPTGGGPLSAGASATAPTALFTPLTGPPSSLHHLPARNARRVPRRWRRDGHGGGWHGRAPWPDADPRAVTRGSVRYGKVPAPSLCSLLAVRRRERGANASPLFLCR